MGGEMLSSSVVSQASPSLLPPIPFYSPRPPPPAQTSGWRGLPMTTSQSVGPQNGEACLTLQRAQGEVLTPDLSHICGCDLSHGDTLLII